MGQSQDRDVQTVILDVAEAIVRQHGFNGFDIDDVAASLNLDRAEIV